MVYSTLISLLDRGVRSMWIQSGSSTDRPLLAIGQVWSSKIDHKNLLTWHLPSKSLTQLIGQTAIAHLIFQ